MRSRPRSSVGKGSPCCRLDGVVDLATSPPLEQLLTELIDEGPDALIMDLTAVTFLASVGLRILAETHERMGGSGKFAVVASGPATARPIQLTKLDEFLALHPTVDDAISGAGRLDRSAVPPRHRYCRKAVKQGQRCLLCPVATFEGCGCRWLPCAPPTRRPPIRQPGSPPTSDLGRSRYCWSRTIAAMRYSSRNSWRMPTSTFRWPGLRRWPTPSASCPECAPTAFCST